MRLIDADNFLERFEKMCETEMEIVIAAILRRALIDEPTAYSVAKVVEELEKLADENYKEYCIAFNSDDRAEYDAYINAIEIVKQGGASDDVCEWKYINDFELTSDNHESKCIERCNYIYCPYCGKKIKVGD